MSVLHIELNRQNHHDAVEDLHHVLSGQTTAEYLEFMLKDRSF